MVANGCKQTNYPYQLPEYQSSKKHLFQLLTRLLAE